MDRLTTKQAAELLGVTPTMIHEHRRLGHLEGFTMSGEVGAGQRFYFDRGEIEALRTGGAPAAKAYRDSKSKRPKAGVQ